MKLSVSGKRAMITAAASGIGKAVAEMFLENGAKVFICDRSEEGLEACKVSLPKIEGIVADVSDSLQVDNFFDEGQAFWGGLDIFVNNAGIAGPIGPVEKLPTKEWEKTIAVNLNGQFYCARRAVPLLKKTSDGSIINMSSNVGMFGWPMRSPYVASKWAVIGFTKTLAMELGEFGIRVNAICPGIVEGPRIEAVIKSEAKARGVEAEIVRETYLAQTSLRTFISVQEIASLILYLCSEAGSSISGQALVVDGNTETMR